MEAKFPLLAWILLLVCVVCVVSEPPIPPTEEGNTFGIMLAIMNGVGNLMN